MLGSVWVRLSERLTHPTQNKSGQAFAILCQPKPIQIISIVLKYQVGHRLTWSNLTNLSQENQQIYEDVPVPSCYQIREVFGVPQPIKRLVGKAILLNNHTARYCIYNEHYEPNLTCSMDKSTVCSYSNMLVIEECSRQRNLVFRLRS